MINFKDADQLNKILQQLPVRTEDNQEEDMLAESVSMERSKPGDLVSGLLAGRSPEKHWREMYVKFCGPFNGDGMHIRQENDSDETLLYSILTHCNDRELDELLAEYGESSKIGQIIAGIRTKDGAAKHLAEEGIDRKLKEIHPSLYQILGEYIEKKGYSTDSDFYNSLHFSRQLFNKIKRPGYNPRKETLFWLTAGLQLDYWDTLRVLNAAGYTFRKDSRRETIIFYVIKNGPYTIDTLNQMLDLFNEKPVGYSD
ncbi:hypothetical protein [Murimonas intestini]|uniref:hypothetical protein n=1 Tax=Murimonas intestini TaxID=1337051 RepID=UPI0011DDA62D|nr:hypothetical protein [Murimonas intestini]